MMMNYFGLVTSSIPPVASKKKAKTKTKKQYHHGGIANPAIAIAVLATSFPGEGMQSRPGRRDLGSES
jgi:hypothetical protein